MANNAIKKGDLARVREIDFVNLFVGGVKKFMEILGVTRMIPKTAGSVLKAYKAVGTLENGEVGEGETIPLSKYKTEPVNFGEIVLKKWRKETTAEAIIERGYDQAVDTTTAKMLQDVVASIRTALFNFLATGTATAVGATFQAALAQAWGQLQVKFENDEIQSVYFMNPLDVADYLASANITLQTAFGMSYVENFLGLGTVFFTSSVPKGKIFATAKDNVVCYYIPVNGADLGEAFDFTSDETGLIGIHEAADYSNMTAADTVVNGLLFFPERLDGIVVATIGGNPDLTSLTIGGLDLTPAFDPATTAYAVATSNATNKVTAVAADPKATIEIKVGTTAVENGSAATWAAGSNTLTVKVTSGDTTKTYTVTVTKS